MRGEKDQLAVKARRVNLEGEKARIVIGGGVDPDRIISITMGVGREGPIVISNMIIMNR